ncbi:hypothetical protein SLEP1_g25254 [Rubroshorea leprosula]|uniref:Rab-GAP TBC domain-containing protein n=1 Tax=Rubroshorea leprosula TaxID=152421 RepID=A0AAV5JSS2_9ROSI|nr:hypothetical protein SLEP1_g25254 [Rubroshorea leprosula]
MWGSGGESADSYYRVRPECSDVPKTKFKIKPGKTLSTRRWQAAFSPEGHLDIGKTLPRIQRGGIHPSIRGEVWEFLLSCYEPKSTFEEREKIRQRRRLQYARWKDECREIFPIVGSGKFITAPVITENGQPIQDPVVLLETNSGTNAANIPNSSEVVKKLTSRGLLDKKVIQWLLQLHQIGLDVVRTDRTLVFYEKQENLSKLWDILSVYAWIDKDVGYCQEADSANNKAEGSKGRAKSIRQYGKFERENMRNGKNDAPLPISVFLVASVLKDKSSKLQHEARGLDDVVKILNDMTGNLDAKKACSGAMKLHKKYLKKAKKP